MRSIRLKKQYNDVNLSNIFELVKNDVAATLNLNIHAFVSDARETVCVALGDGMNDSLAQTLSSVKSRVYTLVPHIDESKYVKLRGKAIVREVPNIKGNYCLIDDKVLLLFDKAMNGVVVKSQDAISTVKKIFEREFWENATEEFIESKRPCAEITFDIPPIYSTDDVILDDGFGETTAVKQLINNADATAYTGKIPANSNDNIILNNIRDNSDYLKTSSNENIYYYPVLPFCCVVSSGNTYAVNFDIADYEKLPESGKGRLFAVKIDGFDCGDYYKFNKHKTIGELVGQTVIDADGKNIEIKENAEESRKIAVDLRLAREFERMESDPETLEARLDKRDAKLLTTNHTAKQVIYNIELQIQPKTLSKKADVYKQFEEANKAYASKKKELSDFVDKIKDKDIKKNFLSLTADTFDTVEEYRNAAEALNAFIDEINNEDSLGELLGSKKAPKSISKLKITDITMDIPKHGVLYQQNSKYEYILNRSSDLDSAINEMKKAGIEQANVAYLEEK
jgi:hypothetical protein